MGGVVGKSFEFSPCLHNVQPNFGPIRKLWHLGDLFCHSKYIFKNILGICFYAQTGGERKGNNLNLYLYNQPNVQIYRPTCSLLK